MEPGKVWCELPEELLQCDLAMEDVSRNALEWVQAEGAFLLEGPPDWVPGRDGYGYLVFPIGRRRQHDQEERAAQRD